VVVVAMLWWWSLLCFSAGGLCTATSTTKRSAPRRSFSMSHNVGRARVRRVLSALFEARQSKDLYSVVAELRGKLNSYSFVTHLHKQLKQLAILHPITTAQVAR